MCALASRTIYVDVGFLLAKNIIYSNLPPMSFETRVYAGLLKGCLSRGDETNKALIIGQCRCFITATLRVGDV